jgi:hypothetical protein
MCITTLADAIERQLLQIQKKMNLSALVPLLSSSMFLQRCIQSKRHPTHIADRYKRSNAAAKEQ